jgi:hypothetical protein
MSGRAPLAKGEVIPAPMPHGWFGAKISLGFKDLFFRELERDETDTNHTDVMFIWRGEKRSISIKPAILPTTTPRSK